MSHTLVALKIGPISTVLAASRRTRDLWFGSFLISEMSKAAAWSLADAGWDLIYPWSKGWEGNCSQMTDDLKPTELGTEPAHLLATAPGAVFNVANVIVARKDGEVGNATEAARKAALARWKWWKSKALKLSTSIVCNKRWKSQDDYFEVLSASLVEGLQFDQSFAALMFQIAAQEATRHFQPAPVNSGAIPKSSLDGRHDTVLMVGQSRSDTQEQRQAALLASNTLNLRLRLAKGEELDALGVTRRTATGEPFPSVVRVAVDPWVRGVAREHAASLAAIDTLCTELGEGASQSGRYFGDSAFKHDGGVLLTGRREAMLGEAAKGGKANARAEKLEKIALHATTLYKTYGEPQPYYALLTADGDNVGALRKHLSTFERHREFSAALTAFALDARTALAAFAGCTVFAAGEDVLALVPLDHAVDAARAVQKVYAQHIGPISPQASISAGLVIAHCNEDLADVLAFANAALKAAKAVEGKNALAVHLFTRGGAPIGLCEPWARCLAERLKAWTDAYVNDAVTRQMGYALYRLAALYEGWAVSAYPAARKLIRAEVSRMVNRKKVNRTVRGLLLDAIGLALGWNAVDRAAPAPMLRHFANELIVAKRLADAAEQASPKGPTLPAATQAAAP